MWATKFNTHTTGKITVLYILIFPIMDSKLEGRRFAPNDNKLSLTTICSQFLPEYNFDWLGFPQIFETLRQVTVPCQVRIKINLNKAV